MPQVTLEDFQLSSDDESHENEGGTGGDTVHDSRNESSKDGVEDDEVDGDPYLQFFTDHEKFEWDESRWEGIPNVRKHEKRTPKPEEDKKEEQGKLETQLKPVEREKLIRRRD